MGNFQEPEEEMFVDIELEDGTVTKCQVMSIFDVGDKEYIALNPLDDASGDDEMEIWFYEYKEDLSDPNADPELIYIEDDDEYEDVVEAFDEYLDELEFDGYEEDDDSE